MGSLSILPVTWTGIEDSRPDSTTSSDPSKQLLYRATRSYIRTERHQVVAPSPESSQVSYLWYLSDIFQRPLIRRHNSFFPT